MPTAAGRSSAPARSAGSVAAAEAVLLAHAGSAHDAERAFVAARAILDRHRLRAEEAGLLYDWGRLLGLPERLGEAAELYRRHGAGSFWLDRIAKEGQSPAW